LRWGKPTSITTPDGLTATMTYDEFGRLLTTKLPNHVGSDIISEVYGWDINVAAGTIKFHKTISPGRPDTKTWYDIIGREIKSETDGFSNNGVPQLITKNQSYNSRGLANSSTDPYIGNEAQLTRSNVYDIYNRLLSQTTNVAAFGSSTLAYAFTNGEFKTTKTNAAGQVSSETLDASGKAISAQDYGGTLTYSYYSHGGIKQVQHGSTVISTILYDAYKMKVSLADINAGSTLYDYDAFGQLISETNPKSETCTYTYDKLGRILTKVYPGSLGTTVYEYFPTGSAASTNKLKKITAFGGSVEEYTYDVLGRILTKKVTIDNVIHTTSYTYNNYNDITSVTYPSGLQLKYFYDSNGYLTFIKNSTESINYVKVDEINGRGQITKYTLGNGKQSTNTYFYGIPTNFSTPAVQNLTLNWNYLTTNLNYRSDGIKNLTEYFTYDDQNLDRLKTWKVGTGSNQLYAIDYSNNGNILNKTDLGTYTYLSTKINALSTVQNSSAVINSQNQSITYNAFEQPISITEGLNQIDFVYGYDENRIRTITKYNGSETNRKYYFGSYEKEIVGSTTKHYHYISVAGLNVIVEKINATETAYYTYSDHLGSILSVTNSSGSVIAEQNFDPWGRKRNTTTWTFTSVPVSPSYLYRGFTGHEHYDAFNLINMNARLYDAVLSRMLSPDNEVGNGMNTQAFNRYSYANNNPLKYTDPDGNNPLIAAVAISVILNSTSNAINGRPIYQGTAQTVVWALVSAGVASGIGGLTSTLKSPVEKALLQAGLHGLYGGISSSIRGGNFGSGFLSGSVSSGMSSLAGDNPFGMGTTGLIAIGGISGGITAQISGGDFWSGLIQGGIVAGFNHAGHSQQATFEQTVIEIATQKGWDLEQVKEYLALVVGESWQGNFKEAQGISEVITRQMNQIGVSLRAQDWSQRIENYFGDYDANNGKTPSYNVVMSKSISQILSPRFLYANQVRGAFIGHVADFNVSKGAYYFNQTAQRNSPRIGYNWSQFNAGKYYITATLGRTTFFNKI
jgi:RHS repeat-associated protein